MIHTREWTEWNSSCSGGSQQYWKGPKNYNCIMLTKNNYLIFTPWRIVSNLNLKSITCSRLKKKKKEDPRYTNTVESHILHTRTPERT